MKDQKQVAIIVGSLRKASFSRKIAKALKELAPDQLKCNFVEIGDLEMYNQDLDSKPPKSWKRFREKISESDAVLFVTPEYNRSLPGCLKNALDVGSRPSGKNVFNGLPAGIVSVTPYSSGAAGSNYALRQALIYLNMPTMQQPEAYISEVESILSPSGKVKSKKSQEVFEKFMKSFSLWINATSKVAKEDFESFLVEHEKNSTPFDISQKGSSGQLAFWTGYQKSKTPKTGKKKPANMNLRVTEIFRFEDEGWKIIHRHADMNTNNQTKEKK